MFNMINKRQIEWVIGLIIVLLLVYGINSVTPREVEQESFVVATMDQHGDFPNPNEGTLVIDFSFDVEKIVNNFNAVPRYIVMLNSKTVEGLGLRYDLMGSSLEGGLPVMIAENIFLLDKQKHQVGYVFKKGGDQVLFFDGNEVARSVFGEGMSAITGNVIMELGGDYEEIAVPSDAQVFDKALTLEEIKKLR